MLFHWRNFSIYVWTFASLARTGSHTKNYKGQGGLIETYTMQFQLPLAFFFPYCV